MTTRTLKKKEYKGGKDFVVNGGNIINPLNIKEKVTDMTYTLHT